MHFLYDTMNIEEISKHSKNKQHAHDIIKEITDKNLHKDVLKFITPFFSADPIKLEDAILKSIKDKDTDKVTKK